MKRSFSRVLKDFAMNDLWVVLLDILAVNLSYLIAIYIRFFVNGSFVASAGYYIDYFWYIAPIYTVLAIATFAVAKLYGNMWRFVGLNDLNRIIMANLVTAVLQVAVSMIVLSLLPIAQATRMPITYYALGAIIQFISVVLIRFSHKILLAEKAKIVSRKIEKVPALVVGSNELGRKIIRHLEENTVFRVVAIIGVDAGRIMDGIPVFSIGEIEKTVFEKKIKTIFIADKSLNNEQRDQIRQAAKDIEINDFTGYMSNKDGFLPLSNLLEVMEMPIHVIVDGKEQVFSSAEECLSMLPGEYDITHLQASKLYLKKREEDKSWMKVYEEQTGHEVSYFD